MRITIETGSVSEMEQILRLLKSLHIRSVQISAAPDEKHPVITKGDKSIDPTPLFGIWKDHPRSLEEIRKENWTRNWND